MGQRLGPRITPDQLGGGLRGIGLVSDLWYFGHSLLSELGASSFDRDGATRLAAALGVREVNRALGGSVMAWNNSEPADQNGGWATMMQFVQRTGGQTASLSLSAQASAGATSLTVASAGTAFVAGDRIFVGTGDTGGSGGEMAWVTGTPTATNIPVRDPLARTHASGEPIFVVPTEYQAIHGLYLLWMGNNDVSYMVFHKAQDVLRHTLRACVSRARASMGGIFEDSNKSVTITGGGGVSTNGRYAASGAGVTTIPASGTVTVNVPDNYDGVGAITCQFIADNTTVGDPTWTIDGASQTVQTVPQHPTAGKLYPFVYRIKGLAAGRHQIVFTRPAGATGNFFFDCWWIEASRPPLILLPGPVRLGIYTSADTGTAATNVEHQHQRGVLNGAASIGNDTITVNQNPATTAGLGGRAISATWPKVDATVVIEPGTANEEITRVRAAASGADPSFTVPVEALTANHADGSEVQIGVSDAAIIRQFLPLHRDVAYEFDTSVRWFDIDEYLFGARATAANPNNLPALGIDNPGHYVDRVHFNDVTHRKVSERCLQELEQSAPLVPNLPASLAAPTVPIPGDMEFCNGPTTFDNLAAATPIFISSSRVVADTPVRRADIRRAVEWRLVGYVKTAANSTARLRVEVSINGGTTWQSLSRKFNWELPADGDVPSGTSTDNHWAQMNVGSTGLKVTTPPYPGASTWHPLPPEIQTDNTLFRVRLVQGAATPDLVMDYLAIQFR